MGQPSVPTRQRDALHRGQDPRPRRGREDRSRLLRELGGKPGTEIGPILPPEAPTQQSKRKVLLFDKPTATQTDVTMSCPLVPWTNETYESGVVLGSSVSEIAWRRLREKAGVTYGAYAYNSTLPGGASTLNIGGLFQNNAAEYAISTYLDLVDLAAAGEFDDSIVATAKWSRPARRCSRSSRRTR